MQRLIGDIRTLRLWAPVRALHEISLRLGITGRILRAGYRRTRPPALVSPFSDLPVDDSAAYLAEADEIVAGRVRRFGRQIRIGETPDWLASDRGRAWPGIPRWRINLRPDDGSDVKYVFELGRHAHLVTLAQAARAAEDPSPYLKTLDHHLTTWFRQSPPETGIHWYSNLEIALRALAWLQVLEFVGDQLDPKVRDGMAGFVYHSGRHIVGELPYTISSMRNNHLIGDAVGLVAIGKAFPGDRRARRWERLGDRLLRWQVPKHIRADGSSIEDSLGYRGFVLELLAARVALGDAPTEVTTALERGMHHLARVGVGSGSVPHFGDWDGGSVFAGPPGKGLPDSSLEIAGAILGRPESEPAATDGSDVGGNMGRIEREPWTAWLKSGAGRSHEHADLLSVSIRHGDNWIVGDPGNGSYNRSQEERDYFRTSIAHDVLRLEGRDQREPHRRFRWRYHPEGMLGAPFGLGDFRVMWGTHDAYERLDPPRTVLRACLVSAGAVVVVDWIIGGSAQWTLSLPLHPDIRVQNPESRIQTESRIENQESRAKSPEPGVLRLPDGSKLALLLPGPAIAVRGSSDPYDGWWTDDYDAAQRATRLEVSGEGSGPVVWAVWSASRPKIEIDDGNIRVDGHELQVGRGIDAVLELRSDEAG